MARIVGLVAASIMVAVEPASGQQVTNTLTAGTDYSFSEKDYLTNVSSGNTSVIRQTGFGQDVRMSGANSSLEVRAVDGSGLSSGSSVAAIFQQTDGVAGGDDTNGGRSGAVTTTLNKVDLKTTVDIGSSAPGGVFGLYARSFGPSGGPSTRDEHNGGAGAFSEAVTITATNGSSASVSSNAGVGGAGVWAEQQGGFGGTGKAESHGGAGGGTRAMSLDLAGMTISTSGAKMAGISAIQTGGAGGNGENDDDIFGAGESDGGAGGSTGGMTIKLPEAASAGATSIRTTGDDAAGVFASATGGAGGKGGLQGSYLSVTSHSGDGGGGGSAGSGSDPAISIHGGGTARIETAGANSAGVHAETLGGAGGDGGTAISGAEVDAGRAGNGGKGGDISITLDTGASIETSGDSSSAILAQAQGGQGGVSGKEDTAASTAVTSVGGTGGAAGVVNVQLGSGVQLKTAGASSDGVTARSLGGKGGDSGGAVGSFTSSRSGDGGAGGYAGGMDVASGATIVTEGDTSRGVLAQAISGIGGASGNASGVFGSESGAPGVGGQVGRVHVSQTGQIATFGDYSQGVLAQSISGSGGAAGSATGSLIKDTGGTATRNSNAGAVDVSNAGSIATAGASAQAIVAQSIGGGGGAGGPAGGVLFADGGDGGLGGSGGAVTLTLGGSLTTAGELGHGAVAQSIGGGGGTGGNAYSGGAAASAAVGGSGGTGGDGGTVAITGDRTLATTTAGTGAIGLVAQSVGGGGGAGGGAYATAVGPIVSIAAALGGSGGSGGKGSSASVSLAGSAIRTGAGSAGDDPAAPPVDALGVVVQSIGGGGGVAAGASANAVAVAVPLPGQETAATSYTFSSALSVGGNGGDGGNGGSAKLALGGAATIGTAGMGSHGALVQSIGGGGGHGGDSSSLAASVGYGLKRVAESTVGNESATVTLSVGGCRSGSTCKGGDGADASFTLGDGGAAMSVIETGGAHAAGAIVQSIGGGGGDAGVGSTQAFSIADRSNKNVAITVGSDGGSGGQGGTASATIASDGVISTTGAAAGGLLVQSIGGGGGVGSGGGLDVSGFLERDVLPGDLIENCGSSHCLASRLGLGGTGSSSGAGGTATAVNHGTIVTAGGDAPGVLVQSIGGGGGVGGASAIEARAASSGGGSSASLSSIGVTLTTTLGATGSGGGAGGTVNVTQGGSIATSGDYSQGLVAQSIGGGGGRGGLAVAGMETDGALSGKAKLTLTSRTTLGRAGSTMSNGGDVHVNLDGGGVQTGAQSGQGFQAVGVLGQSIGGGGGVAADGSAGANGAILLGAGNVQGMSGGGGGDGAAARLSVAKDNVVVTHGDQAFGVLLQSIGGGGGLAGAGTSAATVGAGSGRNVDLTLGASQGSRGDGGAVTADVASDGRLDIVTSGHGASGFVAQSVGGGGGVAGAAGGAAATVRRVGSSGGSGDGGAVNVSLLNDQSTITTAGVGAHGVVAQSVGGGGGMVANFRPDDVPSLTSEAWFTTGGSGRGGAVTVLSLADIHVSGAGAFGIVAQSAGGGGLVADDGKFYAGGVGDGGALKLTLQNRIAATGEGGIGVFAQSTGAQGGAIEVNLGYYKPAAITGGSGAQGAGVVIDSRADSHMYVGEGSQISALSGTAIRSVSGRVDVQNDGAIYGNTYLTGGTIYGAPQIPGQPPSSTALAGVERGVLTNSGTLVASAGGAIIDGDLVQTASGRVAATFDFVAGQSASYLVAGDARLDGKIAPVLASVLPGVRVRALEVQGVATGSLSVEDSPLFSFALHQSGGTYDVSVREAHFAGPDFGLSAHRKDVAEALEAVFESGRPELGALFAGLDAAARAGASHYNQAVREFSPRSAVTALARSAAGAADIADRSMSCPTFSKGYAGGDAVLTEGECGYFKIGGRTTSDDGDGERGRSRLKAAFWQVGGQIEISPGLFLGGSAAYQADWFNGHDGVSGKGSTGQAAITLKRQDGPILWTAAVFGNIGELDLKRRISVAGFSDTAKGAPTLFSGGLRGRVAHTFGTEDLYLRPYLNVDLIYARSGSFKERGAGDLGLAYGAARYKTATFTPAVELGGRSVLSDDLVLRSFVTAGASVRTNDRWRGKAHLRGARNVEEMSLTAPIDSVAAKVGVGLQLFHGERADLRLRYDGEFGSHAKSHGATASVAYRF